MIIDFHTHTFPDHLAENAMKKLVELSNFNLYSDGKESFLNNSLEKGHVTHAVVWPIATKQENVESINRHNVFADFKNLFFQGAMHPKKIPRTAIRLILVN